MPPRAIAVSVSSRSVLPTAGAATGGKRRYGLRSDEVVAAYKYVPLERRKQRVLDYTTSVLFLSKNE